MLTTVATAERRESLERKAWDRDVLRKNCKCGWKARRFCIGLKGYGGEGDSNDEEEFHGWWYGISWGSWRQPLGF